MALLKSPMTVLAEALSGSSLLKSFGQVRIGIEVPAGQRSVNTIALEPTGGSYESPERKSESIADMWIDYNARIWGRDFDHAWNLHERLFQALVALELAGTLSWKRGDELAFEKVGDTTSQGVGIVTTFSVQTYVRRAQLTRGQVDAVEITEE